MKKSRRILKKERRGRVPRLDAAHLFRQYHPNPKRKDGQRALKLDPP
jgi:hypothetical protein